MIINASYGEKEYKPYPQNEMLAKIFFHFCADAVGQAGQARTSWTVFDENHCKQPMMQLHPVM